MRRCPLFTSLWLLAASGLAPAGCVPSAREEADLLSPWPAARLAAIREAGATGDPEAIPPLVEQLESDDPVTRMMSIVALERITGERLGYNPYGSVTERRAAIERWVEAVRAGRFTSPAPADLPRPGKDGLP